MADQIDENVIIRRIRQRHRLRPWAIASYMIFCAGMVAAIVKTAPMASNFFSLLDEWEQTVFKIGAGIGLLFGLASVSILFFGFEAYALFYDRHRDQLLLAYFERSQQHGEDKTNDNTP